ncbi:MAG: hypothetical protein AAFQ89_21725 [Cyanobacteria bacterium J06626_18]
MGGNRLSLCDGGWFSEIVPTPVGVNRFLQRYRLHQKRNCPHACGGEPTLTCNVNPIPLHCPHACGGEPMAADGFTVDSGRCPHVCEGDRRSPRH